MLQSSLSLVNHTAVPTVGFTCRFTSFYVTSHFKQRLTNKQSNGNKGYQTSNQNQTRESKAPFKTKENKPLHSKQGVNTKTIKQIIKSHQRITNKLPNINKRYQTASQIQRSANKPPISNPKQTISNCFANPQDTPPSLG